MKRTWVRIGLAVVVVALVGIVLGSFLLERSDGPVWVLAGGPFRTGEPVAFETIDWTSLDVQHELEMEIVGEGRSRILWFSVEDGIPYVGCDLDCIDGRLSRWPQQVERDPRVVIRIDGKRVDGELIHVAHGTPEYAKAKARRDRKYAGDAGGGAAAETAAHGAVVGVGEVLTGRSNREEPGDRLYRIAPR